VTGAGIGDRDTSPRDQAQGPAVMVPTGAAPSHALGREALIINQIVSGEVFTQTSPHELIGQEPRGGFSKNLIYELLS
jgi:hypothetical protein